MWIGDYVQSIYHLKHCLSSQKHFKKCIASVMQPNYDCSSYLCSLVTSTSHLMIQWTEHRQPQIVAKYAPNPDQGDSGEQSAVASQKPGFPLHTNFIVEASENVHPGSRFPKPSIPAQKQKHVATRCKHRRPQKNLRHQKNRNSVFICLFGVSARYPRYLIRYTNLIKYICCV